MLCRIVGYVETPPSKGNQREYDALAFRTSGMNNVVIAQNMLEKMANDPDAKSYYMSQIQSYFDSRSEGQALLAAQGQQIVSSGVIINEDGTVTSWCYGDYTPEEKARLERLMKEEDEAKAKKRADLARQIDLSYKRKAQATSDSELWFQIKQLQASIAMPGKAKIIA